MNEFLPEIFEFDEVIIDKDPEFANFPVLFTTTQIVCEVSGTPQPNITWYKDGKLLPGQQSQILILEEVSLEDRGRYHCDAQNYDPNKPVIELLIATSDDTVLNIKGKTNYGEVVLSCLT